MSECYLTGMDNPAAAHLAKNIKQLREARQITQDQLARLAGIPRPTVANLESGQANPTLAVLVKLAQAMQVSVESLISSPRSTTQVYRASELASRRRGDVMIRPILPDSFGGLELDRMEFSPGGRMVGWPHKSGTREYLTCESGEIVLAVAGETWRLGPGDVVVFRGDQRHSYHNPAQRTAVGYSVILVGPALI